MEARDERSIRPLPPEIPEGQPPGGPPSGRWRWAPIAAIAAVVFTLGIVGSIMNRDDAGAGGVDPFDAAAPASSTTTLPSLSADAPTTTTTTTTTLPPTLQQLLPGVSAVSAVVQSGTGGASLRWTPLSSDPTETASTGRPSVAAFNIDGTHLAYLSFFGPQTGALHVGSDAFQPAQYLQVTSFAWHQTEPQRLAWVAVNPIEESLYLMTGTVDPVSLVLGIDELVTPVPDLSYVTAWGEWGFLTSRTVSDPAFNVEVDLEGTPDHETVTIPLAVTELREPDGTVTASTPGFVVEASPSGTLLIWSAAEAYEVAAATATSRELGFGGTFVPPHPTGLYLAFADLTALPDQPELTAGLEYALSPDGIQITEVFEGDAVALTTQTVGSLTPRVIRLDGPAHLLGFTPDQEWVLLHDEARSLLVFVDWRSGARRYLELPESGPIVAVDVDQPE